MEKYKKIGIATNKSILELYQMMRDGSLVLQPSFQRKLVWNNKHKENFIQTILMGLPFPEIYLSDGEIDLENMKSKTLVVDGQQRMNTIYQYITNDEELVLKNTKRFNQLTEEEKQDFLDYPVGRFFLALVSMWDTKENRLVIEDLNQLRECFCCNILSESLSCNC